MIVSIGILLYIVPRGLTWRLVVFQKNFAEEIERLPADSFAADILPIPPQYTSGTSNPLRKSHQVPRASASIDLSRSSFSSSMRTYTDGGYLGPRASLSTVRDGVASTESYQIPPISVAGSTEANGKTQMYSTARFSDNLAASVPSQSMSSPPPATDGSSSHANGFDTTSLVSNLLRPRPSLRSTKSNSGGGGGDRRSMLERGLGSIRWRKKAAAMSEQS
jgi:hypothetical protein